MTYIYQNVRNYFAQVIVILNLAYLLLVIAFVTENYDFE